ncbi:MAG: restriction endonuclease subunit S [Bacteroidales bacterium]|nr:restriction endonuclease subunit S [Bacteroidales bacterium]
MPSSLQSGKSDQFSIPYVDIKAFEKGIIERYTDGSKAVICQDGDILIVWDGARCGFTGRAIHGAIGSTLARITPKPGLDKDYLYYFLKSQYQRFNTNVKGMGIPHLNPFIIHHSSFIIPPLPEQHRIVERIEELFSELDNGLASLKQAKEQLKVYRQSVLKWAFEGRLTNRSKDWASIKLGKVAYAVDPQPSHRTPPVVDNGIPYVSIKDFDHKNGKIDFVNARKVSPDILREHCERYQLKEGDFVIGKIGTIGKPIKVILPQVYTLSANIVLIQPININSSFLYYFFQSNIIEKEFLSGKKATTQAAYGIQKVRELKNQNSYAK